MGGRRSCPASWRARGAAAIRSASPCSISTSSRTTTTSGGHQAGDRLLKQSASAWGRELRASDTLARYGGEEFSVALPGCRLENAKDIVERLRAAMPGDQTVSAGVVCWNGHETAEELVGRADAALYEAKRMGRDRLVAAGDTPPGDLSAINFEPDL